MSLVITFFIYVVFFIFHKHTIVEFERLIFAKELVDQASILYIPHAIRIIAYFLLGIISIIPIFLAQCFTYIFLNGSDVFHSISLSSISVISIVFGFYCFNFLRNRNFFQLKSSIDWKKIILIGFFASLFNSTISSIYFSYLNNENLDLILISRFIIGDTVGIIVGMFIFILILKLIKVWKNYEAFKNR